MKQLSIVAACAAGFFLIAAPIYVKMDSHALTMNGRPAANAVFVNGQWAMALDDFAKLGGGTLTLEPNFQLNGNTLSALLPAVQTSIKKADPTLQIQASTVPDTFTVPGAALKQKVYTGGAFHVRKAGVISRNVFRFDGKVWVPLADVARAFGGTFTTPQGNLQPGQSLTLNFAVNGDGVLALNN